MGIYVFGKTFYYRCLSRISAVGWFRIWVFSTHARMLVPKSVLFSIIQTFPPKNNSFPPFSFSSCLRRKNSKQKVSLGVGESSCTTFWHTETANFQITMTWRSTEPRISRFSRNSVIFETLYLRAQGELEARETCFRKPRTWFKRRKNPIEKIFSQTNVTAR